MNRKEAYWEIQTTIGKACEYDPTAVVANVAEVGNAIDKIYDDFESRTCENCKHWFMAITRDEDHNNTKTPTCMLFAKSDDEYTIFPDKDFGCNKFERKS